MIITGLARLGRDAELRYVASGDAVCNLSLAFNYGKKDGSGNQPTQWIDGVLWGKRAEGLAPHLTKGTLLSIVGEEPHIEEWDKADGTKGFKLVTRISAIEFAGGRREQGNDKPSGAVPQPERQAPAARPAGGAPGAFQDFEDDIPFAPIGRRLALMV